jgi:hypothetical protein
VSGGGALAPRACRAAKRGCFALFFMLNKTLGDEHAEAEQALIWQLKHILGALELN